MKCTRNVKHCLHVFSQQTQKKRYFVLRSSPRNGKSRLEYYESEKKFRLKGTPKRVIYLADCWNIAKKTDSKHKSVFVLYTREDAFGLIADSEDKLNAWLQSLKTEQKKDEVLNATGRFQRSRERPQIMAIILSQNVIIFCPRLKLSHFVVNPGFQGVPCLYYVYYFYHPSIYVLFFLVNN